MRVEIQFTQDLLPVDNIQQFLAFFKLATNPPFKSLKCVTKDTQHHSQVVCPQSHWSTDKMLITRLQTTAKQDLCRIRLQGWYHVKGVSLTACSFVIHIYLQNLIVHKTLKYKLSNVNKNCRKIGFVFSNDLNSLFSSLSTPSSV